MLSNDRGEAVSKYRDYMRKIEQKDYDNVRIIGDEAYQLLCSNKKLVQQKKRLDEILIEQGMSQEQYELIKGGSRRRDLTDYRRSYVLECIRLGYTHMEIGKNISLSDAAVRNLITRAISS